jgi:16S rRNA (guanine527-N7)-methyltransferase
LTGPERDLFTNYLNLLRKWQKSQRLIGSAEPGWIVEKLFLDSLLFLRVLPARLGSLLDLGSGAGLPGIPIKIVRPEIQLVLLESRQRRASFLSNAVRELALERVSVVSGRAEELAEELGERFDAVVMRCAGDVERLFPVAARFVMPGGLVVASGPPRERPLSLGEWVTVGAGEGGKTRRFAVYCRA